MGNMLSRVKKFLLENYPIIFLLLVYSALWLPHVFIINENLSTIYAYEVDSGTSMSSVINMLKTYNLNGSGSSRYYGWSFYFVVFILIKLIMFASHVFSYILKPFFHIARFRVVDDPIWLFTSVRMIICLIGMASLVALYSLIKKIFHNRLYAFLGSLFYVFPIFGESMFYFVHPETTGLLFLQLSILAYLRMREVEDVKRVWKYFYVAIVLLAFSAWAKQIFFFTAVPVFIVMITELSKKEKFPFLSFVRSLVFLKSVLVTVGIGLLTLFIIHPYFYFNFRYSISYQKELFAGQSASYISLSLGAAWLVWLKTILANVPIMVLLFMSAISVAIQAIKKGPKDYFLLVCSVSSLILTVIVFSNARVFAGYLHYLQPIYPFYLISGVSVVVSFSKLRNPRRVVVMAAIALVFGYSFCFTATRDIAASYIRLNYKTMVQYKLYEYINKNIPDGSKLAISHNVIISPEKKFIVFFWWGGQNWEGQKIDELEIFNPDYMVYLPAFSINGKLMNEAAAYNNYAVKNNYTEISRMGDFVVLHRN
jgi:hypothetical protein